jgi:hypothetical protein
VVGAGVEIRPAEAADIPHLAEMFLQSTRGIADWIYRDTIPGRPTPVIVGSGSRSAVS